MSYSEPVHETINLGSVDFGTGGLITSFRAPAGYENGRILEVQARVTETFACDATPGTVSIGTAADPDAYALLNIADATAATDTFNSRDDSDAIIDADIDDTQIEVVCAVGVDAGTEAGIADISIVVSWF
jgi:hypothetical protein